ncbi:MAG: SDR family oxidoreductase [Chloroflexota bacterium]
MTNILENQVAIITGSGQGIGAAAAKLFAVHGAKVVVSDLDADKSNDMVAEIKNAGGEAFAIPGDVTDPNFPDELIGRTVEQYGKINTVVNNAGFTWDGMLHKIKPEQWDAIIAVHLTAPFRIIQATTPYMRDIAKKELEAGNGFSEPRCIVNVSSTSGLHGNVGQANYAAGKMGIVGLTKTVAKEWGMFGIRCNAVAFGLIDTRLTRAKENRESIDFQGQRIALGVPEKLRQMAPGRIPLGRAATTEEAAGGIFMLASPFAGYITGHTLEVTGGAGI